MLTPAQIEQRLSYLTGSDASIICGVNPYQSAIDLWQLKTRRTVAKDISDNPAVKAGNMLEEAVAQWFCFETGKQVYNDNQFFIHPTIPFLGGNLDRLVVGEDAILECKTAQSDKGWGAGFEQGDNIIPDHYLCQVIHYLAITNRSVAYVAVLIRGMDFRWFKYERNQELEDKIIAMEVDFWHNNIQKDVCPEPQNQEDVLTFLRGRINNDVAVADLSIELEVEALKDVREEIKSLQDKEQQHKDQIALFMLDNDTLVNSAGRILVTWKQRAGSTRFDNVKFKKEHPDLYAQYEKQGEPTRTFLVK